MATSFTAKKESVNFDQLSPVPFTFIFKLAKHLAPSSIGDRPSKLVVLDHVSKCQIFNSNHAIVLNQARSQLVQKIDTSIFDFGVYFSYFKSSFISIVRAFGFPTQQLLRDFELLIQLIKMLWIGYLVSITGSQQTRSLFVINPFLPLVPAFSLSSKSLVVNEPDTTHCPSQETLLLGIRVKTVKCKKLNWRRTFLLPPTFVWRGSPVRKQMKPEPKKDSIVRVPGIGIEYVAHLNEETYWMVNPEEEKLWFLK